MRGYIKYGLFVFITASILVSPDKAIVYALSGMELCREVLIPSLFPFFVCSGLLIYSGFCEKLAGVFSVVMKPLFRLNGSSAAAFVLGMISGYPLGAETAVKLYENKNITKTECERLLAFCNNSGPLFILGSVGVGIYHSAKIGAMLYLAHIMSAISVGVLSRFYKGKVISPIKPTENLPEKSMGEIFQSALSGSVSSMLSVCGAVVFFSVLANLAADLMPEGTLRTLFVAMSELTSGIRGIAKGNAPVSAKLIMSSAVAGFAGLCVHLQVMSVAAGKGISLLPYILGKILHGVLAAVYTALILRLFPITVSVFSRGNSISGAFFMSSVFTMGCSLVLALIAGIGCVFLRIRSKRRFL